MLGGRYTEVDGWMGVARFAIVGHRAAARG